MLKNSSPLWSDQDSRERERGSVERFLVFVLFRSCSHCTQNEVVLVLHLLKSKEGLCGTQESGNCSSEL